MRALAALIIAILLTACTTPMMTNPTPPAAVAELAPGGKLRAAINFGNPVLATRDTVTGAPRGISVDLAGELGQRLGVPVELVTYTAAGKVVEGLKANAWDVAFVAIDPARAVDMDYTAPYLLIEGGYLVRNSSPIRTNEDVDRDGVRVVVGAGSAYDLYLTRELKRAQIVRAPTSPAVTDMMVDNALDVAAGVKQQLEADAARVPDVHVLAGRFMVIRQAMATPKGRPAGVRYLADFIEEMKASGFVVNAFVRHRIEGAAIAPPAERR